MVDRQRRQVTAHRGAERHRIERLGQYALGAERGVLRDLVGPHTCGQKHNRDVGGPRVLAKVGKRCRAVHERHHDIEEDNRRRPLGRCYERVRARCAGACLKLRVETQRHIDHLADVGFVVHEQNANVGHTTSLSGLARREARRSRTVATRLSIDVCELASAVCTWISDAKRAPFAENTTTGITLPLLSRSSGSKSGLAPLASATSSTARSKSLVFSAFFAAAIELTVTTSPIAPSAQATLSSSST